MYRLGLAGEYFVGVYGYNLSAGLPFVISTSVQSGLTCLLARASAMFWPSLTPVCGAWVHRLRRWALWTGASDCNGQTS